MTKNYSISSIKIFRMACKKNNLHFDTHARTHTVILHSVIEKLGRRKLQTQIIVNYELIMNHKSYFCNDNNCYHFILILLHLFVCFVTFITTFITIYDKLNHGCVEQLRGYTKRRLRSLKQTRPISNKQFICEQRNTGSTRHIITQKKTKELRN